MYWSLTFVILQELELKINSLESIQSETTEKNDININEVGKQTTCICICICILFFTPSYNTLAAQ